jgi:cobalt-zinc-cadmium efflux system protein
MSVKSEDSKLGDHHGHNHSRGGDGNIGLAFFLNLSFTVIELIGGAFTNSIAVMSDAVHDLGDSVTLALAWFFQKKSKKGNTNKYTYGYRRFSLLGAIVTSIMSIIGSAYILAEAVPRLFYPQETNASGMFLLAVLGIIIKGIAVLRTRKGSSINERVVSLHLLGDALGWAALLIGSAVIYFTKLTIIDPILSIAIAFYIGFNVVKNIRQALPILLQRAPAEIKREDVINNLMAVERVVDVHDLHIWSLDEEYNVLTAHVVVEDLTPMNELARLKEEIRSVLKNDKIQHATIEFESRAEECAYKFRT